MELLSRKRKSSPNQSDDHFSLEDFQVRKNKKLKTQQEAPKILPSSMNHQQARGVKRKFGCVDPSTRMRKKNMEKEYKLGSELGRGQFGSVRLCHKIKTSINGDLDQEEFACKSLIKGRGDIVQKEVEIMQHLSGHPGIVTLRAAYEDKTHFHLVMELCSGGRLKDKMAKYNNCSHPELQAACILKELVSIIKFCHEMGVVHRDIKPANILLSKSGKMKLADFGIATRISNGRHLSGVAGTASHVAPEVLTGEYYTEKVDIWSAGVILHSLLVGDVPFKGDTTEAIFEAVKNVKLDFNSERWESISEQARDLISRMLLRDPTARITADEVLKHPWILIHTTEQSAKSEEDICINSKVVAEEEGQNNCNFLVDALAAAISKVKISAPESKLRFCGATGIPIRGFMKANNACAAF